jgi:hypothetical protein
MILKTAVDRFPNTRRNASLRERFNLFALPRRMQCARGKIAHFLDSPAALFLLADHTYAASSRLAGKPKKSTRLPVQLRFLG